MKRAESNVVQFEMSGPKVKQIIKQIAVDSSRVVITDHAQERMLERSITLMQVITCLLHGKITEGPYINLKYGLWTFNIEYLSAGDLVTVSASLDKDKKGDYIVVITAF